ncbi:MAG: restriction endonuclease subunit S, partial [bacterium]
VIQLKNGYAFKSSLYDDSGEYLIVTIANVQDGFMDLLDCKRISSLPRDIQTHQKLVLGDLLISMTGNVGRVCRVSSMNTLLNQRVGKLVAYDIDKGFLFYMIHARRFLKQMVIKAQGGAQGNLGKNDILEYETVIPSDKNEQTAIATVLSVMDAEIAALEKKLAKYRLLKEGMMQQLLIGKIRIYGTHH